MTLKLYSNWNSSCSWRLRLALRYKNIPHEIIPVAYDDIKKADFLAINPAGKIPVLVTPESDVLSESGAILEYLEEAFSTPPLLPKDLIKRAKCRSICHFIISGIQPFQNVGFMPEVGENWSKAFVSEKLKVLEETLKANSGKCCVGDNVTMADICFIPQIFNASYRFGIDLSPFATISRIAGFLESLNFVVESHPSKQPDAPEDLKSISTIIVSK